MILTTGRDLEEEIQALDQGAAEIIHRPYAPEIILRRAENLMELYESRRINKKSGSLNDGFKMDLMKSQTVNLFWKDKNRRFMGANRKFLDTYGFSDVSAILGKTDEDMGWHVDEGPFKEDEWKVLEHGEVITNQIGNCIIQGVAHNILASKEPIYQDGEIVGLMGFFVCIDDLRGENGNPAAIEIRDKVTGLMSTHGVTNMLTQYAEGWTTRNENFAVIRISVSEFYRATKTFGEKAAKQMLIDMSRMIKDIFGRDGTYARLYEGNFVVLLKCKDKNYVKSFSTLILERLNKVHMLAGHGAATNPEVEIYFADEVKDLQDMLVLACGGNIFDIEERRQLEERDK